MAMLHKCEMVLFQISFTRWLGLLNEYLLSNYPLNAALISTMGNVKKQKSRQLPDNLFQDKNLKRYSIPSSSANQHSRCHRDCVA